MQMYIGEGFAGNGVNAAHINIMIGPRDGVVGQAFAASLASPSQGITLYRRYQAECSRCR